MDIDNPAPQWHARHLDLALGSLYAAFPGTLSTMLDIKDLNLADGTAASRGEYGFDRLAIGRVDASLTRKRPKAGRTATPASSLTPKPKKADARTWPPKDLPVIRIGRLGLLDGAKIVVMDQTLSPPAISTAHIDTLAIENIDTTDPAARGDVRMRARLDQAEVTIDGWALPFQPKPDFDLRAKVSELVLPSVNPYVGPEVGLDIVEGNLIADAEARADAGQLKGEIRAKVIDLGFADRPEAGSDRISHPRRAAQHHRRSAAGRGWFHRLQPAVRRRPAVSGVRLLGYDLERHLPRSAGAHHPSVQADLRLDRSDVGDERGWESGRTGADTDPVRARRRHARGRRPKYPSRHARDSSGSSEDRRHLPDPRQGPKQRRARRWRTSHGSGWRQSRRL